MNDRQAGPERGGADRVAGQALSPRAFRAFGVEAVVLGPMREQAGLQRREGVAVWRRLPQHAALFDRLASQAPLVGDDGGGELRAVPVVVATAPARSRSLRVPAVGARVDWARAAAVAIADEPLDPGWLLLVDEGPGETWLYLAEGDTGEEALAGFLGRRGRTDFGRARRRTRHGGVGSAGVFAGLVLLVYAPALGLGGAGQVFGLGLLTASVLLLVRARPR